MYKRYFAQRDFLSKSQNWKSELYIVHILSKMKDFSEIDGKGERAWGQTVVHTKAWIVSVGFCSCGEEIRSVRLL